MAKPASSRCNLKCRYCYYLDKPKNEVMDDATLESFIRQQIDAQPGKDVQFAWQGGEPTLCGLDFFRRVVALQMQYADGKRIHNAFQTNGILITDAWCRFFHDNDWLVGISLDGPADLHDTWRVNRSGKPTHFKVMEAIARLVAHRVDFNLLTVVNRQNSQHAERVYRYLRRQGTPFIQFIPLMELDKNGEPSAESVTAEAWGDFLTTVFDVWVREDVGRTYVQLFDSTLGAWSGYPSQMCAQSETCGHAFALEANGDVYQCDHFVYPQHRLGNIHHTTLAEMNRSPAAIAFGENKKSLLPQACQECHMRQLCNGDCPKHRTADGVSALCEGYQRFFTYTAPYMKVMRDLIKQHRSPVELMVMLQP
ncbi:anaerobic sulfatase maturase [Trabulsiella odontotermitis]|uniref:anaerobic sulfatase maturase n=1 Tax=Trabulsiella odontotermitis TaxID=379893 RepID=UPI003211AE36